VVVVSSLSVGIPFTVGFRLSRSHWLSRIHFLETFLSLLKSRLSQSLSRTSFFHDWILAVMEPLLNYFFHDGISAITKPFSNFFFSLWNFGYHGAFLKLLFFYDKISAITEPFSNFFFPRWNFRRHALWGKTLFIYITDSIYIGFASLKTLPLDLGPLCKEKSMVLLILN
jgi:hypothetical protein